MSMETMKMLQRLRSLPSELAYHAYTVFLFTKSDYKTTIGPISLFACAAAPLASLDRLPHVVFWIWFHLLHFNISNQSLKPEEDEYNKPDRPLAAKRLSLETARKLRWAFVPACFALSACYSVETLYASIALCGLTVVYDDLGYGSGHWFIRNFLNGVGFASFDVGGMLVAGDRHRLDTVGLISVFCSFGIFTTTIQSQDFKDTVGDIRIGRRTLAIICPDIARPTLGLLMIAWTTGLSFLFQLDVVSALVFHVVAVVVGVRFMIYRGIKEDQHNYYVYNVWLAMAHATPAYFRFIASAPELQS